MGRWTAFKPRGQFNYARSTIRSHWAQLHAADCVPLPGDTDVLEAWILFHNGHFQEAFRLGLALEEAGSIVANKSACVYATFLERIESRRLTLLEAACDRASAHLLSAPNDAHAHYALAHALASYGQEISVAKALAQGLGTRIQQALETAISLEPRHADAHFALGAFHAFIIDKVGPLIGNLTYGVKRETSLLMFERGLALQPQSPIGLVEYANALVMLEGDAKQEQCQVLYRQAGALRPLDAHQFLKLAFAKGRPRG